MPDELKSFLVSVSIILIIALFIPCIESIVKLVRRHSERQQANAEASEVKPRESLRREVAS